MQGYVYLIGSSTYWWFKIGKSTTPDVRIKDIGILLPFKIEVFAVWKTSDHSLLESTLHEKYNHLRINGEWFRFPPRRIKQMIERDVPNLRLYTERVFTMTSFTNLDQDRCPEGHQIVVSYVRTNNVKGKLFQKTFVPAGITPEETDQL